jgi:hypothetical protein
MLKISLNSRQAICNVYCEMTDFAGFWLAAAKHYLKLQLSLSEKAEKLSVISGLQR